MITRRTFTGLIAGAALTPNASWGQAANGTTVFYASVGPDLTLYDIDVDAATLTRRSTVSLPENVHYAWAHPSRRYLYVASSNSGPGASGIIGERHYLSAFRIDPVSGTVASHGPNVRLDSRPIHISVDNAGGYVLSAYNAPSNVTVHRINRDGTLGDLVNQPQKPDVGIFAHQVRTTPSNRTAILVTRGNNAAPGKPEEPGALKVFGFNAGVLTNLASIAPGTGLGFGPRHLDFHPTRPFVFVSVERQSQIAVYRIGPDGALGRDALFVKSTLAAPQGPLPTGEGAGTIHIHPNGRFAYIPNRAAGTVRFQDKNVFSGGDNTIAVFALNQDTGEPTLIQNVEGHGVQLRTFGIHPSARLLVAASIQPILVRNGQAVENLSAGLSVYRMGNDGKLTFARKYDIDTAKGTQFWSGMLTLA